MAPKPAGSNQDACPASYLIVRQRQHTITEWLLRAHAHETRGGLKLWVFDKETTDIREQPTSTFLAPQNDHSVEIEVELNRIESPAARAAAELHRLADPHGGGFIRIAGTDDPDETRIALPRDAGAIEGFRLTVIEAQTRRLDSRHRSALGSFVALMYSRSPKLQEATQNMAAAYGKGLREAADRLSGRTPRKVAQELAVAAERVRWVGLTEATQLGERLAAGAWWLLKADDGEAFVLGDSAVMTTLAVGHDDVWRPLFDPATYAVLLPLGPSLLLLISSNPMIPGAGPTYDPVNTTNMLSWKWANRFVAGPSRESLEDLRTRIEAAGWGRSAPAIVDLEEAYRKGANFVAPYIAAKVGRRGKRRPNRPG